MKITQFGTVSKTKDNELVIADFKFEGEGESQPDKHQIILCIIKELLDTVGCTNCKCIPIK